MDFGARWVWLAAPVFACGLAAAGRGGTADSEPRYDTATVVDLRVVAGEMRETAKGSPLAGMHLMARLETARSDSDTLDIYLGPTEFIKDFDFPFRPGTRLEVVGSKVRLGNASVVLAREVRHNNDTLYIRDSKGEPLWKELVKGA